MGAQANLNKEGLHIDSGNDSIVIRNYVAGIKGGRTLDMTGFPSNIQCIKAGHVVIRSKTDETLYKPMPVKGDGSGYESLPADCDYAGVVVASRPADCPIVGIMYAGEVNDVASPYPVKEIAAAIKAALPDLHFMHD